MQLSKRLPVETRMALYGFVLDAEAKRFRETAREIRQKRQRRRVALSLSSHSRLDKHSPGESENER